MPLSITPPFSLTSLMFNQQILYGFSHSLLTYEFLDSLLKKGFDINTELFNGDGEMGKDILYFYLQTFQQNTNDLFKIIEKILDSGFVFKQEINYFYLFLERISYPQSEPFLRKILLKTILRMINAGMKTNDVCVYYDDVTHKNKCIVLIDKLNKNDCVVQFSSVIFNIGFTFENIFNQEDLIFDQEIVLAEEPHENIKYLCQIKNRYVSHCYYNGRLLYEIKKYKFVGFGSS